MMSPSEHEAITDVFDTGSEAETPAPRPSLAAADPGAAPVADEPYAAPESDPRPNPEPDQFDPFEPSTGLLPSANEGAAAPDLAFGAQPTDALNLESWISDELIPPHG